MEFTENCISLAMARDGVIAVIRLATQRKFSEIKETSWIQRGRFNVGFVELAQSG